MSHDVTHWFEYGDPGDSDRVPAQIRVRTTGHNGGHSDDVTVGTLDVDALGVLERDAELRTAHQPTDDGGEVLLSAVSEQAAERLLSSFEEADADE